MKPLRDFTHKDFVWSWSDAQEKAWDNVNKLISVAPVLAYYQPAEQLEIQCDSSQSGLGAALLQNGQPVAYASRALTETESRYAQIEKEVLAVVIALKGSMIKHLVGTQLSIQITNLSSQFSRNPNIEHQRDYKE